MPFKKPTHFFLFRLFFSSYKAGETALHSVSGIPQGRNNEDDHVTVVQILLEHGANLTFTTYQVMSQPLVVESKGDYIFIFTIIFTMIALHYRHAVYFNAKV